MTKFKFVPPPIEGGLLEVQLSRAGFDHRTIADIPFIPTPQNALETIQHGKGWPYKHNKANYLLRDRAQVSTVYAGCLRISEVVKGKDKRTNNNGNGSGLRKSQLKFSAEDGCYYFEGVKLVKEKVTRKGVPVPRKHSYRDRVYLPAEGPRKPFTDIILAWAKQVPEDQYLFPYGRVRAWQITRALTGQWNHYFRMIGENYLYPAWNKDVMALADYLKVDPRTLMYYLRGSWSDKPKV